MKHFFRPALCLLVLALAGTSASLAYTVYFKDGTSVNAKQKYAIRGSEAIILLRNGTTASYPADQIDIEKTEEGNTNNLGSAMVLEGGKVVGADRQTNAKSKRTLSDAISSGQAGIRQRAEIRREDAENNGGSSSQKRRGYLTAERAPYRNLEVAGEIQQQYQVKGIEKIQVFQGSGTDRVLMDVKTNSEASVFLSLEIAAATLIRLQELYPGDVNTFEILMRTEAGQLGGQFELTHELAAALAAGGMETSAFFIDHVDF